MSEIIGRQIELGVGVEPTRGTPPGTVERWLKKIKATVVEKAEKVIDPSTHGKLEDADGARVVRKWIEGTFEGVMHADAIGYFLYNVFGSVSSAWVASGVYRHTFSLLQSVLHPSLSMFAKDGSAQQNVFTRIMCSELKLSAAIDSLVQVSANVMGEDATTDTESPSYSTEYDFVARDITLKFADTEAGLSGATAVKATDVEVTMGQAVIPNHVIGSYTPDDIYNANLAITMRFTRAFADKTFKDLFLADTYKYVQLTVEGAADIGGGNHPKLLLTLNRAQVMGWERDGGPDELVTEPIEVKAFYNATDAEMATVILTNNTAEYASAPSA